MATLWEFPAPNVATWAFIDVAGSTPVASANQDSFVRETGLCRLQLGEPLSHPARHGEVPLSLVAVECLRERRGGFIAAAGGGENLGEVAERVALEVQPVGPLDDRDRFAGERLGLDVLPAIGEDARLHLPPERLCRQVLLVAEVRPCWASGSASVVAAERAKRTAEHRRVCREIVETVTAPRAVAEDAQVAGGGLVVAGERRDLGEESLRLRRR